MAVQVRWYSVLIAVTLIMAIIALVISLKPEVTGNFWKLGMGRMCCNEWEPIWGDCEYFSLAVQKYAGGYTTYQDEEGQSQTMSCSLMNQLNGQTPPPGLDASVLEWACKKGSIVPNGEWINGICRSTSTCFCENKESGSTCAADCDCGDGVCAGGESCAKDCHCGDGVCQVYESYASCAADCYSFTCGNGNCQFGENYESCASDCPLTTCGDGSCTGGETMQNCLPDCHCGNSVCEKVETRSSCPADCPQLTCGDNICNAGETIQNCPHDCTCGDDSCNNGETSSSCPLDCHCGDGYCSSGESVATCGFDCFVPGCGNGACEAGEKTTCPADCPNGAATCGDGCCDDDQCCCQWGAETTTDWFELMGVGIPPGPIVISCQETTVQGQTWINAQLGVRYHAYPVCNWVQWHYECKEWGPAPCATKPTEPPFVCAQAN